MKIIRSILSHIRGDQNINKLIKRGLKIGTGCKLGSCIIDPSHCFHITIGDNVTFGPHVRILAHDASTKVFLDYTRVANVTIGNNVFIGAESIVLPGVSIGNNVIIGAGSIISRNIPANSVAIGRPAKVTKNLSDYLTQKKNEMNSNNTFGEEYTLRNSGFSDIHRESLIKACNTYGQIFVK